MGLFRVDVHDLGWTYVEATSASRAIQVVQQQLLGTLSIRASVASVSIKRQWRAQPEEERAAYLASVSRSVHYAQGGAVRKRREQLEADLEDLRGLENWVKQQRAGQPPLSPQTNAALTAILLSSRRPLRRRPGRKRAIDR